MEQGFGKLRLVKALGLKNYQILTVAATAGSEHPIVPSSALDAYIEKKKNLKRIKVMSVLKKKILMMNQSWIVRANLLTKCRHGLCQTIAMFC
jgi:hypothetical protein